MADAKITLSVTPQEFDFLREVFTKTRDEALKLSRDRDYKDATARHEQGMLAGRCEDFLRKLR